MGWEQCGSHFLIELRPFTFKHNDFSSRAISCNIPDNFQYGLIFFLASTYFYDLITTYTLTVGLRHVVDLWSAIGYGLTKECV